MRTDRRHVLVTGGTGYLGGELVHRLRAAGHLVEATWSSHAPVDTARADGECPTWHRLDVRRQGDVLGLVEQVRPETVVHTAFAKGDWRATADGAAHVARAAGAVGARLVHVSSDALFSGHATHYPESADPDPISPYGAAKAAAETAVRALAPEAVIVRTSLILGNGGSALERLTHQLATGTRAGVLFTDDVRCPVHVDDLADALVELCGSRHHGIAHVAGPDAVSRYELGVLIARRDGLDASLLPAGSRAEFGVPGPLVVRLDSAATQSTLRTRLRGAREFLAST